MALLIPPYAIIGRMTPAAVEPKPVYQFKAGRYSSHALLLSELPHGGEGRRVLDLGCAGGYLSEALAARGYAVTSVDQPGTPHAPGLDFVGANLDEGLRGSIPTFLSPAAK